MFLKHVTKCPWTLPISLIMQSNKQINFRILVSTCDYLSAICSTSKTSTFIFHMCICVVCMHITCVCKHMYADAHMFMCVDIQSWHWVSSLLFINLISWGRISHKTLSLQILTHLGSLPWGASVSPLQVLQSLRATRPDNHWGPPHLLSFYVYPKDPSFKAKFLTYITSALSTDLSLPGPRV